MPMSQQPSEILPAEAAASRHTISRRKLLHLAGISALGGRLAAGTPVYADSTSTRFALIGDFGYEKYSNRDVSQRVKSWNPEFIVTLGDNNYPDGEYATIDKHIGQYYHEFIAPYKGSYGAGATVNRFFPSLGNNDYNSTYGYQAHLDYFTLPGNERYYDFVWGPVHFFILNGDGSEPDGVRATSKQAKWFELAIKSSTKPWKFVVTHNPPYCSRTSWTSRQWPYKEWGASAVFSGNAHLYERLEIDGLTYVVNGLGGRSLGWFDTQIPGSKVQFDDDYGAMLGEVTTTQADFYFYTRAGVLIDSWTLKPGSSGGGDPAPSVNLLPYSEEFEKWLWVQGASVVPNVAVAPDNQTTADQINDSTSGSQPRVAWEITADGGAYTFSCHLRAGTHSTASLCIRENGAIRVAQNVTLSSSWKRFALSLGTTQSGSALRVEVYPGSRSGESGNIQAWGAQLEKGTSATTYQRTPAAASASTTQRILTPQNQIHPQRYGYPNRYPGGPFRR